MCHCLTSFIVCAIETCKEGCWPIEVSKLPKISRTIMRSFIYNSNEGPLRWTSNHRYATVLIGAYASNSTKMKASGKGPNWGPYFKPRNSCSACVELHGLELRAPMAVLRFGASALGAQAVATADRKSARSCAGSRLPRPRSGFQIALTTLFFWMFRAACPSHKRPEPSLHVVFAGKAVIKILGVLSLCFYVFRFGAQG